MRLILASASPRRLDILKMIGVTPDAVLGADLDESERKGELVRDYVSRLALEKAAAVAAREPHAAVLAADTAVAVGGRILPKAETEAQARDCLDLMSGRAHRVWTGVALSVPGGAVRLRAVESRVKVARLTEAEIAAYLASGEWRGKAGGYAIQGLFARHVENVVGSHTNIVGLPARETYNLLKGSRAHHVMTRAVLIACGAAETTGALVAGGEIVRFFFAPARGDEAISRAAEAGDVVLGRIKTAAPALGGAFVDIGACEDAFLPVRPNAKPPPEGSAQPFCVRRPAIGGKGAVLSLDWKQGMTMQRIEDFSAAQGAPRLLSQSVDPAVVIARRARDFGAPEIVTDRPEALRALSAEGASARCDDRRVLEAGVEEALAASFEPATALGDGARLIIEETSGGAVVDIDAGAAADAARKPNDRVNERAARVIFRELARRAVGGRVIVDFLPPSSPTARRKLVDLIEAQDASLFERRAGKLAPDGLFDMTAPRRDRSLLERASEPAGDNFLRAGRQLSLDWAAKRAIAALEARLLRLPRTRLSLDAGGEIARYLEARPQWLARLAERFGARVTILADAKRARTFDVREI